MAYTEQEKKDRAEIFKCAKSYLGSSYNSQRVRTQASKYMMENSAKDICNAIRYIYEVLKKEPQDAKGGIGLVPYVMEESKQYFARLLAIQANQQNLEGINVNALLSAPPKEVQVRRTPLERPRSVQLFELA